MSLCSAVNTRMCSLYSGGAELVTQLCGGVGCGIDVCGDVCGDELT